MEEYPLATPSGDDRTMGILSHILTIVPGVGIFAPLVIYLIRKNDAPFVEANAKESLNWQITVILLYFIAGILAILLIGFLLLPIVWVLNLILVIIASIKASENKIYRYPFSMRLVK
jgi:uncharacterized Tic20 family protein